MELEKIIRNRESIRMFDGRPVEEEVLNKILDDGHLAPTAKNMQPQKIYVLTKDKDLKLVDEVTPCRFGSKTVLLVCSDLNLAYKNQYGFCADEMDASIVSSFMLLSAYDHGVGSIWVENFNRTATSEKFDLPANIKPELFMMLGYADSKYPGSINKGKRKPLSETVERR